MPKMYEFNQPCQHPEKKKFLEGKKLRSAVQKKVALLQIVRAMKIATSLVLFGIHCHHAKVLIHLPTS